MINNYPQIPNKSEILLSRLIHQRKKKQTIIVEDTQVLDPRDLYKRKDFSQNRKKTIPGVALNMRKSMNMVNSPSPPKRDRIPFVQLNQNKTIFQSHQVPEKRFVNNSVDLPNISDSLLQISQLSHQTPDLNEVSIQITVQDQAVNEKTKVLQKQDSQNSEKSLLFSFQTAKNDLHTPGPAPTVTAKILNQRESTSPLKKTYINIENSTTSNASPKHSGLNFGIYGQFAMFNTANNTPPVQIVKNPHHEPYKNKRRLSTFKNSNADMMHIMPDKKSSSRIRNTLVLKSQTSIKEKKQMSSLDNSSMPSEKSLKQTIQESGQVALKETNAINSQDSSNVPIVVATTSIQVRRPTSPTIDQGFKKLSSTHSLENVKLPEIKQNFKLVENSTIQQLMHTQKHNAFYTSFRKSQQDGLKPTLEMSGQDMLQVQPFPGPANFPWSNTQKSKHVFKSKVITQRLQPIKNVMQEFQSYELTEPAVQEPIVDSSPINRLRVNKIKRNPVLSLKSQKYTQKKKEQQIAIAKSIALKNSMIQEQNFNFFLNESITLKKSNLPYTQLQFMQIIESHKNSVYHTGSDDPTPIVMSRSPSGERLEEFVIKGESKQSRLSENVVTKKCPSPLGISDDEVKPYNSNQIPIIMQGHSIQTNESPGIKSKKKGRYDANQKKIKQAKKKLNIDTSQTQLRTSTLKGSNMTFFDNQPQIQDQNPMPMTVRSLTGFGIKPLPQPEQQKRKFSPPEIIENKEEQSPEPQLDLAPWNEENMIVIENEDETAPPTRELAATVDFNRSHRFQKSIRAKKTQKKGKQQIQRLNQSVDQSLVLLQGLENLDENSLMNYQSDFDDERDEQGTAAINQEGRKIIRAINNSTSAKKIKPKVAKKSTMQLSSKAIIKKINLDRYSPSGGLKPIVSSQVSHFEKLDKGGGKVIFDDKSSSYYFKKDDEY